MLHNSRKRSPSPSDDDSSDCESPFPDSSTTSPRARRQRRKNRRISVTVTHVDYSSSDDEHDAKEAADIDEEVEVSSGGNHENDAVFQVENVYSVEYELESDSCDEKNKTISDNESDSNSESSDVEAALISTAVAILDTDFGNLGDSSDTDDSIVDHYDPELGIGDTWKCVKCHQPNIPYIRYCQRCWKERKGWVPDRPKPHKGKRKNKATHGQSVKGSKAVSENCHKNSEMSVDSGVGSQSSLNSMSSDEWEKTSDKDAVTVTELGLSNPSMICTICCMRPKDASFIHGKYSHQVSCYRCAKKLYKQKQSCPVCRRKIEKITKHILA